MTACRFTLLHIASSLQTWGWLTLNDRRGKPRILVHPLTRATHFDTGCLSHRHGSAFRECHWGCLKGKPLESKGHALHQARKDIREKATLRKLVLATIVAVVTKSTHTHTQNNNHPKNIELLKLTSWMEWPKGV